MQHTDSRHQCFKPNINLTILVSSLNQSFFTVKLGDRCQDMVAFSHVLNKYFKSVVIFLKLSSVWHMDVCFLSVCFHPVFATKYLAICSVMLFLKKHLRYRNEYRPTFHVLAIPTHSSVSSYEFPVRRTLILIIRRKWRSSQRPLYFPVKYNLRFPRQRCWSNRDDSFLLLHSKNRIKLKWDHLNPIN